MTAINWLIEQIKNDQNQKALTGLEWMKVFEQAKEMEKQQIIDSHISGYDSSGESAEDYYQHYYGSNESFAKSSEKQYLSQTNTSQTEISDEEIKKNAEAVYPIKEDMYMDLWAENKSWVEGAKWYREQLKKKQ